MHDDYKPLDLSQIASVPPNGSGPVLEPCPICGNAGQLWQYSESETSPRKLLVMCSHGDRIGPQDGLTNEGCPFYMPRDGHYRETIRDAVRYWNELARAIVALRTCGVPAFDATKPCVLTTADPTRTYCERCKNPHHACDHAAGVPAVDERCNVARRLAGLSVPEHCAKCGMSACKGADGVMGTQGGKQK